MNKWIAGWIITAVLVASAAYAVDTKISGRTSASTLDGSEIVPLVQGGVDVQTTVTTLLGGAVAGWPTVSTTKEITWANSLANAVRIGDGITPGCLYTDATLGFTITPCTASNISIKIPTDFTWTLWDTEGAAAIETVDPDAASVKAIWTYGTAYRPVKAIYVPAGAVSTDGTQCAAPAEVTINSGAKRWTVLCADNDNSFIFFEVHMPTNYDGATITVSESVVQTAADTSNLSFKVAAACRKDGDTINNTFGTAIQVTTAMGGSNKRDSAQTAAITPNGTCTGGTQADPVLLQFKYNVDATGTTTAMATTHHTGFTIWYSETSRSN